MEAFTVYETSTYYYVVGTYVGQERDAPASTTTNDPLKFVGQDGGPPSGTHRVVKIHRMEPRDLVLQEDQIEYTDSQMDALLVMVDSGNKATGGVDCVGSGVGVLGFVRFLEGYYMVLVTDRVRMGELGPHPVYRIASTMLLYLPHPSVRIHSLDEGRYTSSWSKIELVHDFYFSYGYDLSHSLQHNMNHPYPRTDLLNAGVDPDSSRPPCTRGFAQDPAAYPNPFASLPDERTWVWNLYLMKDAWPCLTHKEWLLPVVHGFFRQRIVTVYDRPLTLTLIARRSRFYAGTRYLKRGISDRGKVANEVETEQIVCDGGAALLMGGAYASYVTLRGSIPLTWSQEQSIVTPKPPIVLHASDPFYSATALHFADLFRRYGAPLLVLNLVKQREKVPREQIIGTEFARAVRHLNTAIDDAPARIRYEAFDMARATKSRDANVIASLAARAKAIVAATGFFHAGYEPTRNRVEAELAAATDHQGPASEPVGGAPYRTHAPGREQRGVARFNCIDSLDRTNAAQFVLGKLVLGHQLYALGLADSPDLEFDTALMDTLTEMYEAMGDSIALQYGGSQLNHRVATYRNSSWSSYSRDMMTAIRRYYSNSFSDAEKQEAMNLFLGLYVPMAGKKHLWAIGSDHYLHNDVTPRFVAPRLKGSFAPDAPLPSLVDCIREELQFWTRGLEARARASAALHAIGGSLPSYDSFAAYYAVGSLTKLADLIEAFERNAVEPPESRRRRKKAKKSRAARVRALFSSSSKRGRASGAADSGPNGESPAPSEPDSDSDGIYISPFVKSKGTIADGTNSTIERLGGVSRWMRVNATARRASNLYKTRSHAESAVPFPRASDSLRPLPVADTATFAAWVELTSSSATTLAPATTYTGLASFSGSAASAYPVPPARSRVYADYVDRPRHVAGLDWTTQ